jgi:hypothetical protein
MYSQAQPTQPQSQGTPYNPQQGQNFGGQRQVQFGMPDQERNQAMTAWTQPKQQLLQWGQNLPQFQQYQPQQGMQPQDLWGRNSALVQQINDSQANQDVGTWLGQGAPPPNWGNQNLDPQAMLQQAQTMLQQGWQNPFAAQPAVQPWEAAARANQAAYEQQRQAATLEQQRGAAAAAANQMAAQPAVQPSGPPTQAGPTPPASPQPEGSRQFGFTPPAPPPSQTGPRPAAASPWQPHRWQTGPAPRRQHAPLPMRWHQQKR